MHDHRVLESTKQNMVNVITSNDQQGLEFTKRQCPDLPIQESTTSIKKKVTCTTPSIWNDHYVQLTTKFIKKVSGAMTQSLVIQNVNKAKTGQKERPLSPRTYNS